MAKARIVAHEPRCQHVDCLRLATVRVIMWRRSYGPYCGEHGDVVAASQDAFEAELDATAPV